MNTQLDNRMPLVSIITVSYNNVEYLKKTLTSISEQSYPNIECVIIDGESTDGSVEIIKDFSSTFYNSNKKNRSVKWLSEKDSGIYNAINKGLERCTGEVIGCLWDVFAEQTSLEDLIAEMMAKKADAVHSDLVYVDENGKVVRDWRTGQGRIIEGWMPGHPTLYIKRDVFLKYGKYREDLSSAADFEYMARIFKDETTKIAYLPKYTVRMFYGGYSTSNCNAYVRSIVQSYKALKINGYHFSALIVLKRIVKTLRQF